MANNAARIAEIQELLRSGASSVTTDGTSTQFDVASLRTELRQLMEEDDDHAGRRPVAASIELGNF